MLKKKNYDYKILRQISSGKFSSVFEATKNNDIYIIEADVNNEQLFFCLFNHEIEKLSNLDS